MFKELCFDPMAFTGMVIVTMSVNLKRDPFGITAEVARLAEK